MSRNRVSRRRSKDSVYATPSPEHFLWLLDHVAVCARVLEQARAAECEGSGIDKPTRRLMEELNDSGPRPVPALAAALGVKRQSVQPLVDALVAAGRAEILPNYRKRRSPLVRLSEAGFQALSALYDKEAEAAAQMSERFLAAHVAVTRKTLVNLIYAYSGGRPWELPRLRAGYAAYHATADARDDATLNRYPITAAGLVF